MWGNSGNVIRAQKVPGRAPRPGHGWPANLEKTREEIERAFPFTLTSSSLSSQAAGVPVVRMHRRTAAPADPVPTAPLNRRDQALGAPTTCPSTEAARSHRRRGQWHFRTLTIHGQSAGGRTISFQKSEVFTVHGNMDMHCPT